MTDPRVRRGNNFALNNLAPSKPPTNNSPNDKKRSNQRQKKERAKQIAELKRQAPQFIPVPLEEHLIAAIPKVDEIEESTQTDEFVAVAYDETYLPPKSGIDASTQIVPEDKLFNFDLEVEPLVNVLAGKTMEQALMEVEEEEELKAIKERLRILIDAKEAERKRALRMVDNARSTYRSNDDTIKAQIEKLETEDEVRKKLVAVNVSKVISEEVLRKTEDKLVEEGAFYDPLRQDVESLFVSWLYTESDVEIQRLIQSKHIVDDLVKEMAKKQALLQCAQKDTDGGYIRIFVKGKGLGTDMIGPIPVTGNESVEDVEKKIQLWMERNVGHVKPPEGGYLRLAYGGKHTSDTKLLDMDVP